MTLTLRNNDEIDLYNILRLEVVKMLDFNDKGRMYVRGWDVVAWNRDGSKQLLAAFGRGQRPEAVAMKQLINDMIIFNTQN